MNSPRPEPEYAVLVPAEEEQSFVWRAHRIVAHSLRLRARAARMRLSSRAIIAKGRILREQSKRQRIG